MTRSFTLALLVIGLWVAACSAQSEAPSPAKLTVEPVMAKGPAEAPVTIVEFSDYEWPFCKRAQQVLGQVLAEFPDKVRLVLKDFPLDFHAGARPAAEAARCAGAAGSYWEYHDLLYAAQPSFARDELVAYAGRLGLDRAAFAACLERGQFRSEVERDLSEGRALGVTGTPTFFVNGRRIVGAHPIEAFREAVKDALDEAARK